MRIFKSIIGTFLIFLTITNFNFAQELEIIAAPAGFEYSEGYLGDPIVYKDLLYGRYLNAEGQSVLAQFDGVEWIALPAPLGFEFGAYGGDPIIFQDQLYLRYIDNNGIAQLMRFDGSNFSQTSQHLSEYLQANSGYQGQPIIFGNQLYLKYQSTDGTAQLVKFDGFQFQSIQTLENINYEGEAIVFQNQLYLQFSNAQQNFQMFRFDGQALNVVAGSQGYQGNAFIHQNQLYFGLNQNLVRLHHQNIETIAKAYKGYAATLKGAAFLYFNTPQGQLNLFALNAEEMNPVNTPKGYTISNELATIHNHRLYLSFINKQGNTLMGIFDGSNFKLLSNPETYQTQYSGYQNESIVFQDKLYFRMGNEQFKSSMALLSDAQQVEALNDQMTDLKVYPNPIRNDQITLQLTNEVEGIAIIQVFDQNGQLMARQSALKFGPQLEETVSLKNMPNGIYSVQLVQPEAGIQAVQQIVKLAD